MHGDHHHQQEEGSDGGGASFHLSRWGLAALTASGAGLVHTYGVVTVLLFPVLLLALVARMVLGLYQAFNILVDLGLGATILLFLVLEDRCRRLFAKGWVSSGNHSQTGLIDM